VVGLAAPVGDVRWGVEVGSDDLQDTAVAHSRQHPDDAKNQVGAALTGEVYGQMRTGIWLRRKTSLAVLPRTTSTTGCAP
jgi:hypothetical protein